MSLEPGLCLRGCWPGGPGSPSPQWLTCVCVGGQHQDSCPQRQAVAPRLPHFSAAAVCAHLLLQHRLMHSELGTAQNKGHWL